MQDMSHIISQIIKNCQKCSTPQLTNSIPTNPPRRMVIIAFPERALLDLSRWRWYHLPSVNGGRYCSRLLPRYISFVSFMISVLGRDVFCHVCAVLGSPWWNRRSGIYVDSRGETHLGCVDDGWWLMVDFNLELVWIVDELRLGRRSLYGVVDFLQWKSLGLASSFKLRGVRDVEVQPRAAM